MFGIGPLVGQPNPELERITLHQVVLLTFIVVGIAVLIGSLSYLLTFAR